MRLKIRLRALLVLFIVILMPALASADDPQRPQEIIRGVYGDLAPFWKKDLKLNDYGINAVFVRSGSIDDALVKRARAEGCSVFAEFATLNGGYDNYVRDHPDAHPIDDEGNPARKATWFMGVCPTHRGFRESRMNALRELLRKHDLDGVWMDYLHWHAQFEDPYPQLVKTCFNDSCIDAFETFANVKVQGETIPERSRWIFMNAPKQWEDWRVSVINDWARQIREITKSVRPNALVGVYHTAWKDEDLGGVRRRCLGLDFRQLAEHVDVFSPMIYHGRSGKPPESVKDFVDYFSTRYHVQTERTKFPQLWPIVQAHDEPRISPEEFESVLRHGLSAKSTGVMMFTIGSVAADEGKLAAMKRVYESAAK